VYIKLVVLLRNYVTMMHGQQNIKNGWATIVVVGRLRVKLQGPYAEDEEEEEEEEEGEEEGGGGSQYRQQSD
jgi:hypothetical protein